MDNAEFVERVRDLCREQKTSITKLEAQLDFSNGYIGKWAKRPSSPPYEKLTSIAQALGVTVEDLTGEEQKEKPSTVGEMDLSSLSPEDAELVKKILNASEAKKNAIRELL